MTHTKYFLLILVLLSLSTFSHAQIACPPGQMPYSATDRYSCGPAPNYNQTQPPQPPAVRWISTWGAVASDVSHGVIGAATGLSNKYEASQAALADCRAKGGLDCTFDLAYDNECVALVADATGYVVAANKTIELAIQDGKRKCEEGQDQSCKAYYTDCSLPKQVQ